MGILVVTRVPDLPQPTSPFIHFFVVCFDDGDGNKKGKHYLQEMLEKIFLNSNLSSIANFFVLFCFCVV